MQRFGAMLLESASKSGRLVPYMWLAVACSPPCVLLRPVLQVAARVATMASYSLQSDSMAPPHATTA